ncbi:AbrB family transcriptional regulator [Antribacter sp. KLBMP9083]|uniref:AbrB family transcriptional regulator n=1 Tax=Antribacter soli TaxID=2910976 RepID=A0AA41U4Y4_9MICO|nr:AbrB family transcriptional regulator [Antribacter soli]MCF4119458.1 AbrB family transcriptional regulator [Antribacter soli]
MSWERTRWQGYLLVAAVAIGTSVLLDLAGMPSPVLFGALAGGMAHALTSPTRIDLPAPLFRVAQGLIGVITGSMVSAAALASMAASWPTIALVTLGTVAVSLAAGQVLALRRDVNRVTGAFALLVGAASGMVATARELGADDRVVTVVQYLRVLVVLVTIPLVTTVVFDAGDAHAALPVTDPRLGRSLAFVGVSLVLGLLLARVLRFPTAVVLAPIVVAAVIAAEGWLGPVAVPEPVQWFAYALIGAQVGLRFTRASLVAIARLLPAVLGIIVVMVVVTALMGGLLALLTPVDGITAYLATTPGGIFAVLAIAADTGADATYVVAVQTARLLVILAIAPLLARWYGRRP